MGPRLVLAACLLAGPIDVSAASPEKPTFFARRDYPDYAFNQAAVADTNGDGIPDLIESIGGSVQVLFGNGNGTFRQGPETRTGMGFAPSFATADLTGGTVDLVMAGQNEDYAWGIGVCLGNGDGTFQTAVFYPAGSDTNTSAIALGDFNGDGIIDAVTAGVSGIWLFTGKGGGAFNPGVLIPFNPGGPLGGDLAAADFRKDGKLDLVASTLTGFAVLLGNGDGTFQPQQNFSNLQNPGNNPCDFAVGPLSSGGYPAIVANCASLSQVPVYLGNGKGGFSQPVYVSMPGEAVQVVADVNGDGIPDLVSSYGYVALGEGGGKFKAPVLYPVEDSIETVGGSVVAAHLRSASFVDLVVQGTGAVSVLLNTDNKGFEDGRWTALPSPAGCGAAADYNGDGKPDLAVNTSEGISILLGTGSASAPFTLGTPIALSGAGCLVTGDLTGSGNAGLLVPTATAVDAYLGDGNGTFTLKSSTPVATEGYVALADFNRDGKLDFASSANVLALGNGDGTFKTPVPLVASLPTGGFTNIAAGDLNGDGWPDLVLTNWYYTETIYILLNNQHGGFTESTIACKEPYCSPSQVILADVNGDGNLDIVVGEALAGGAVIYLGNGKGGFTEKSSLSAVLMATGPIMVGDVNGDGVPDIGMMQAGTLGIFLGNGDGTYTAPFYIGAGPGPADILTENLHGQAASAGLPDIVAPDGTGGVMVLINTTTPASKPAQ